MWISKRSHYLAKTAILNLVTLKFHANGHTRHSISCIFLQLPTKIIFQECTLLASYGCTTVRNEILVPTYSGLEFGDASKNNVKHGDDKLSIIDKLAFICLVCILI